MNPSRIRKQKYVANLRSFLFLFFCKTSIVAIVEYFFFKKRPSNTEINIGCFRRDLPVVKLFDPCQKQCCGFVWCFFFIINKYLYLNVPYLEQSLAEAGSVSTI